MKKYLLAVLLLASLQSFGQFLNYTNINGRYKWIAGKFDSTFTIPSGTTPSLRTGGGNAPGALFYSTTDSTVYQYTGTQWTRLRGSDTAHVISAYVRNTTASAMTPGQVVYINGSTGTTPTIALANNKQDSTSAMTFGFVRGNIPVNGFGYITTFGPLEGVNTNAYTEGEVIYLDSIPGQFTHDKPQAPYHMVTLGYIIKKSGGNGTIYAKIQNGYELDELHNVRITEPVLNKSVIIYDSVRRLWVDTTVSAAGLGLGGSGTTNYVSKWTGSTALGNSQIFDNGTSVGIGTATPSASYIFDVNGNQRNQSTLSITGGSGTIAGINGLHIWFQGGTTANISAIQQGTSGRALAIGGYPLTFVNSHSGGEMARFTTNGRLLIGTTTESTFELDLVGDFRSTLDANINGLTVGKGGGSVATNTAFGVSALAVNTTGARNTAIGSNAGAANITSSDLTFVGANAGQSATGQSNTAIGSDAANRLTSGASNLFVGRSSGYATTTGSQNVYVGMQSGYDVTTASNNTIIGYNTGRGITTGQQNTILGSNITGLSATLANHTIIADGQGNMRLVAFNDGNVYIGGSTTLPTNGGYKLDVNGTARVQNNSGLTLALGTSTAPTYWTGYNSIFFGVSSSLYAVNNSNDAGMWVNAVFDGSNFKRVRTGFGGGFGFNNNGEYTLSIFDYAVGAVNITTAQTDNILFAKYGVGLVINDDGKSTIDFRIEGDTNANLFFTKASTDNIGMGTNTPNASALLDVSSTTKGFAPPRGTNAQMLAIVSPVAGLIFYDTTNNKLNVYDGTNWVATH